MSARLETSWSADGSYAFEDALAVRGRVSLTIITATAWLLELFELRRGAVYFMRGQERIALRSKRMAVFYPRFSMCEPCFEDASGRVFGLAGTKPIDCPAYPILFEIDLLPKSARLIDARAILRSARGVQSVELNPRASALSRKAKRLIDERYLGACAVGEIAERLGVSHAHLARQFKRDFAMSPRDYLHRLRLADAPRRLAKEEGIARVAHDVGYNDLSRFYRQFRKRMGSSPAACARILKRRN